MKGTVVYLYAFDVAGEIRSALVTRVLSRSPEPFQIRVGATVPRDVPFYRPLTIRLPQEEADSSVGRIRLAPVVKIFDVGVVSISYEVPFEVDKLADLVPYHQLRLGSRTLTERAEDLCAQVAAELRPFMDRPTADRPPAEAYTVFCLSDVQGDAEAWVRSRGGEVAGLLNEEPDPGRLAASQVEETLSQALSYTRDDVVVVDWDAALVVDRSGYYDDVLYVIELANLQLEEFRLLDDRLDRLFLEAYEDLDEYYRRRSLFHRTEKRMRALRSIRMDITKMSEELSNITKFVGDWYLARVYLACKDRFHLGHWEASVDTKLLELDRLYSLVHQEINERRMLVLEATIVALFLLDLAAIFLFKG